MEQPIICEAENITPQWLSAALAENGYGKDVIISAVSSEIIGTGKMGDNARLNLSLEKAPDTKAGGTQKHLANRLANSIIAKLPAADPIAKELAAGSGAYSREVLFYQQQAKYTDMRLPEIYYSAVNEQGDEFIILMQDMTPAVPGDQIIGETEARAILAMEEAAKLHSAFWGSKNLHGDHISRPYDAANSEFGGALLVDAWPKFLDRFSSGLSEECIAFGDRFANGYSKWIGRFNGQRTLVHSDFRSENILFVDDPTKASATTVDWQSIAEGCGLTDVAYFLGGSLPVETRRKSEKMLVERYRSALAYRDVQLTAEQCWEQYREFSMSAFMTVILGAVYTAAGERSDQMFLTMAQRHFQQCIDLNSGDFL